MHLILQKFRKEKKRKRASRSTAGNFIVFFWLAVLGSFMAIPLFYSIINSFKPLDELFLFPPRFFVSRPTTNNYFMLFKLASNMWVPFSRYIFNSIFVSVIATAGHVIIASMAAYPLSKFKLKYGNFLFNIVILSLLFTGTVLWLPQYLIMSRTGMINTYLVYIVPSLAAPLGLFLMKQFMEKIPYVLIESATVDGARHFYVFWKIVMPQVKPAWLTLIVFSFQGVWNQQPFNMVYDEQLKLINMALTQIISSGIARLGPAMASGVILMLPPIIVFLLTQNSVIETMASSGIKE